jgi:hypothetical protein
MYRIYLNLFSGLRSGKGFSGLTLKKMHSIYVQGKPNYFSLSKVQVGTGNGNY